MSRIRFFRSLSMELDVQANRVRDLIGSRHWGTDGAHKEALLTRFLAGHLPAGVRAARGFVLSASNERKCSTEQDILVLDTAAQMPVFDNGSVVAGFPTAILAAISVKTVYSRTQLHDALRGLCTIPLPRRQQIPWLGVFFFEGTRSGGPTPKKIHRDITQSPHYEALSCSTETGVRVGSALYARVLEANGAQRATAHAMPSELSTAVFLSRLLQACADARGARPPDFDAAIVDDAMEGATVYPPTPAP